MIKTTLRSAATLLFAYAACVSAQDEARSVEPPRWAAHERFTFRELDVDYDGRLSRREAAFRSIGAAWFEAADANRDGRLTREEFRDATREPPAQNGPSR